MSRDVRAGKAYVELGLRAKLDKGLQKASKKLRRFGQNAVAIGAGLAGSSAAILTPLLTAAANAQEVASKFDTVFGSNADMIRQWGSEFADQVGRSRVMIDEFLSSSQDLFVPLGFDSGSAEKMSKTITGLSIDLASFNNKADADVMNDLQAALTGSGEVMKKYGVILSESAVKQELLNQALDPKNATNAQKVQARLNIIMRGTTAAQGDALRTAGSFTNQTKRLWANLSNLAVTLGKHLIPPATAIVGLFNRGANAVMKFAEENQGLVKTILFLVSGAGAVGAVLLVVGGAALAMGVVIPPIVSGFGLIASVFGAIIGPATIAVAAIAAIGAVIFLYRDTIKDWAMQFWDAVAPVRDAVMEIWAVVTKTFGGIGDAIKAGDYKAAVRILWAGIKLAFFTGAERALEAWDWLRDQVTTIATTMFDRLGTIATAILEQFGGVGTAIGGVFGAVFDWLGDALGAVFDNFKQVFGGIASALMSGNIGLAAEILWASIQVAFISGTSAIKTLWSGFVFGLKETWSIATSGIVSIFQSVVSTIASVMETIFGKLSKLLGQVAEYDPTGAAAGVAAALNATSTAFGAAQQAIDSQQQTAEEKRNRQQIARVRAHADELKAISDKTSAAKAKRDALIAKGNAAGDGFTIAGLREASSIDLEKLLADAKASAEVADTSNVEEEQQKSVDQGRKTASKGKTAGTFSALGAQLLGLGGNNAAEETARNTREMAQSLSRIERKKSDQPGPVFQ